MAKKTNSPPQRSRYRIFFSYASDDRGIVELLRDAILEIGIDVVLDAHIILSGDCISEKLQRELQICDELVLYYSNFTKQKPWVHLEVGAAWVLEKRITVITHGQSLDPGRDWGMAWLGDLKYVTLNDFKTSFLGELTARSTNGTTSIGSRGRQELGAKQ